VAIDAPLGREVLVEVRASGLCHTDLMFATTELSPLPAVYGHEVAGVVIGIGPNVTQLQLGDHVVATLTQSCGACPRCVSARTYQCQNPGATLRAPGQPPRLTLDGKPVFQGFGLGGFAERALIHENQLAVLPREFPFAQAALLGCGVVTGAGSVLNTAGVAAGETVVVIGAGGVGLNALTGARIAGATRIVAVDINQHRLDMARQFGATDVIDSSKGDAVAALHDLLPGGADHVFDFVGISAVSQQGYDMLGVGGGLYMAGAVDPRASVSVGVIGAIGQQTRVQGVNYGSTNFKRDIPMYADLYLQGRMNLDDLVSREISLAEVNEGYEALHSGTLNRVVITSF
ncbi:MAG: zinc-binding dehydrogenase, partial [Paracoccus sp. (in: a-proteobacteria)]|uniref:zinc-binding dehydrogenase n=1 Tax=Paracoccus sp. TaxID=267 RepID=UPI0026DEAD6D